MKKILLLGGTSLVGQALLKNKTHKFVAPKREELDLSKPESIVKFDYKGFDCLILVAGAGMRHGRKFEFKEKEVDFDYIQNTIAVNCTGMTMLLKKYLAKNKKGHVVVIGSISVTELQSRNVVYASSKTYLDRITDLLSNIYTQTTFIKINPCKMQSRFDKNPEFISGKTMAETVWSAIDNNIKRLDIFE